MLMEDDEFSEFLALGGNKPAANCRSVFCGVLCYCIVE